MYQPLDMLVEDRSIVVPARRGKTLFHQGDPCESIFEIREGVARAVSHTREGFRQVTAFFFPGDLIGLPLSNDHRYSAEAVRNLRYVRHSPASWQSELARTCREESRVLDAVWAEERVFMARSLILGRVGMLARMATFLADVASRLPHKDGMMEFPLPQTDIASYLATSPETVCRSLRQLREFRIIAMPRRDRVKILELERLFMIAEGE